jgi:hypothetical protein
MKTRIGSATSAGLKDFSSDSRKNSAERTRGAQARRGVVDAVQIGSDLWVVHAFQKKSKTGIGTPAHELPPAAWAPHCRMVRRPLHLPSSTSGLSARPPVLTAVSVMLAEVPVYDGSSSSFEGRSNTPIHCLSSSSAM